VTAARRPADKVAAPGDRCPVPARAGGRRISPTLISQYVRLDQCRRYLRLALHERAEGRGFLYAADVAPQEIPPLLTKTGAAFERRVEAAAASVFPVHLLQPERADASREGDNDVVIESARHLPSGETLILFQPRLRVSLAGWDVTGDADVVRLERDHEGVLDVLVADMKATTTAKVEHRLQVAFYREMIERLLADAGVEHGGVAIGILYRGGPNQEEGEEAQERERRERERLEAVRLFGVEDALFEATPDPEAYRDAVRELVTAPASVANTVIATSFAEIPWHLTYKCDGCVYNEYCMKWAAEHDDLSLLPHLTDQEKSALRTAGIATTRDLSALLAPAANSDTGERDLRTLVPAPGAEPIARRVARTWPVGPRLDELVHRARRYRFQQGDDIDWLPYIPSKGYGSLPYSDADQNPNLVRVYVDAQHDYLADRIYLIGSLVTGNVGGEPDPVRRRSTVVMAEGVPDEEAERELLVAWIDGTIRAIAEVAAPDAEGQPNAPIHLIFYNSFEQRLLLEALSRHAREILAATPVYDFMTQLAAFDSPVATFLDREIRELKNYPFVCQSLQAVAATVRPHGVRFDWNEGTPYREIFRERMFDALGRFDALVGTDGKAPWATRRARFNSQIPLEYAYAAWGALDEPPPGEKDPYAPYRKASVALLTGFQARRLEALEHVTKDFAGNKDTTKTSFAIPDLAAFDGKARGLAEALQEFVTIERHVALAAWKAARLPPPERRVLAGDTLLVRYHEADQVPGVVETYAENARRAEVYKEQRERFFAANPGAKLFKRTPEEKVLSEPLTIEHPFRLRVDVADCQVSLDDALALSTLKGGERIVLASRWTQDERLPVEERVDLTPTPKQLLYRMRCDIEEIEVERDGDGRARTAWLSVRPSPPMQSRNPPGFLFQGHPEDLVDGKLYSVDPDPNDIYGFWGAKVVEGLVAGGQNTLFSRVRDGAGRVEWPEAAAAGQRRFMAGLLALYEIGAGVGFEASKIEFVAERGDEALLLVQGPPGTGKSFTTAYAILARMQGAMAARIPYRVVAGTKTHAATDVLLSAVVDARRRLRDVAEAYPDLFATFFDQRLLGVPLFRVQPRNDVPEGVTPLIAGDRRPNDQQKIVPLLRDAEYAIVAATPGGIYSVAKEEKTLFGNCVTDLLVLDEASQLSLPESIMAALLLRPDGQIVVVGDHRQMAPIVQHDWENETRRTFQEYAVYRSLFETARQAGAAMIQFERSFRLDRDMAEFLRRAIYAQDDLAYHSERTGRLADVDDALPFVRAALSPEHPLVVIVHDERASQLRNDFERHLTAPLLTALHQAGYRVRDGFGLVVPHRAQRANLQDSLRAVLPGAEDPDEVARAVDTVERFQGGERDAIIVSATESDPAYLLAAGQFLYDPRRLTVAISRARDKMVLVASRSVFELFSPDEETFASAQVWKDLLFRTCTVPLWAGELAEHRVEVWGNPSLTT
jgi:hypothetical protein